MGTTYARTLEAASARGQGAGTVAMRALLEAVMQAVPDDLLQDDRQIYVDYLLQRASEPRDLQAETPVRRAVLHRVQEQLFQAAAEAVAYHRVREVLPL